MLNVVLFEPEIPSNTGNIGRTCVVTGARLHLIRPYGFELTDPLLKRAGMNYWHNLDVAEYDNWDNFTARALGWKPGRPAPERDPRLHLLTKRADMVYTQATYRDGDYLVFGKESTGIARAVLEAHPACCERIPMLPDAAALDDAPAWHARHEQLRRDICGNFVVDEGPDGTGTAGGAAGDARPHAGISSLNLSNSVAVVLYEALRQTGYPGM